AIEEKLKLYLFHRIGGGGKKTFWTSICYRCKKGGFGIENFPPLNAVNRGLGFGLTGVGPARDVVRGIGHCKYPVQRRMLFPIGVLEYVRLKLHRGAFDQRSACSDCLRARKCWLSMDGAHVRIGCYQPDMQSAWQRYAVNGMGLSECVVDAG